MAQALITAASELRYLLARGYPREKVLALVGDRHGLDAAARRMLRRGVFDPAYARRARGKRLGLDALAKSSLAVDGHNVIITLETALGGGVLVAADDGWLRDIAQLGRNHRPGPRTYEAAGLMVGWLARAGAAKARIRLDAPLPKSGELAAELGRIMARAGLAGDAQAVAVPEKFLFAHPGPVASSDSAVIDKVDRPLDLAGLIISGEEMPFILEKLV